MDLFNFFQPPEDDSFYMRVAAVNQMSQMMHSLMMNPLGNMGPIDPLGRSIMGIEAQPMLGPPVGVPAIRHSVPSNPWMDLFSPGAGSSFQSMSMLSGDPSVHSYCSSTMMSMTTGPDGRPMVYQATSSTRSGPGGVCETQKSVCDNVTGTKKMQIGRHIGNRGHVIEREQNFISGEKEEREDFINIEEEEADKFSEEFEWRARMTRMQPNSYTSRAPAITSGQQNDNRGTMLALPSPRAYTSSESSATSTGWTENPYGGTWYSNQSGNTESPRNPNRAGRDNGRSTGDSYHSRRLRHGQPRRGKDQVWSRRK